MKEGDSLILLPAWEERREKGVVMEGDRVVKHVRKGKVEKSLEGEEEGG